MPHPWRVIRILLVVYCVGSVVVTVLLLVAPGLTGGFGLTTSGEVLAAAVLALGLGALSAARDPWRGRPVIQVLIAFTALAALPMIYRLAAEHYPHDRAWVLLPIDLAIPLLLALFYPREGTGQNGLWRDRAE